MTSPPTAAHRCFWPLAVGLLLMSALALQQAPGTDGVRVMIRWTARSSLVFFLLAHGAQALLTCWPGPLTAWLRQRRRQWGWLLVCSHTIHAAGLVALAMMAPALFDQLAPLGNRITGGLAYVVLWAMGATSFDRSAAWLGRVWWARLHTWGSHYLWLSFLVANGKRIPHDPRYWWPVLALLLVQGLRWWAARHTGDTAQHCAIDRAGQ
jgi:methionine sulfoxide reductase heme-binding subunit